jgi:Tol biopolymer transport system component
LTSPTSGRSNIFIRDLISGTTTLISINKAATLDGNNNSFVPSISSTGKFVAFESLASNLVDDDTNGLSDIFLRNRDADGDGTFD